LGSKIIIGSLKAQKGSIHWQDNFVSTSTVQLSLNQEIASMQKLQGVSSDRSEECGTAGG
jgi:hypothetical protein